MKTKKMFAALFAAALVSTIFFTGCGSDNNTTTTTANGSTGTSESKTATTASVSGSAGRDTSDEGEPVLGENDPFLMPVDDVFTITGKGTALSGHVIAGSIKTGDIVQIAGSGKEPKQGKVVSIQKFQDETGTVSFDETAAVIVDKDSITRDDVERGMFVMLPDAYKTVKTFEADVYFHTAEECSDPEAVGEIKTDEVFDFYVNSGSFSGTVTFTDERETVNPGDSVHAIIDLQNPTILDGVKTTGKYDKLRIWKNNKAIGVCKITGTVNETEDVAVTEEKTEFDVVLQSYEGNQKIEAIKKLREVTGLGLVEAKAAIDDAPTTIKQGVIKDEAEQIKKELEDLGAVIEIS